MSAARSWSLLLLCAALAGLGACRATAKKIEGPWDAGTDGSQRRDRGLRPDIGEPDFGDPDFYPPRDLGSSDRPQRDGRPTTDLMLLRDASAGDGPACSTANDSCSAPKKLTWSGMAIAETGDTSCARDDLDFDIETCGDVLLDGTLGPDVFYEITLPAGSYRISLDAPSFDPALYVLTSCAQTSCVGASDEVNPGVREALYLKVGASTKYLIGVDSYDPAERGPFKLVIEESALPPDAGPPADAGPAADGQPASGSVVITEMMIDPAAVGDAAGEWFELYNGGAGPVNLKGWRIADAGSNKHTIAADVFLPPGGYVVLGKSKDLTANGGAPVTYAYSGFDLANTEDEIMLYDAANKLVDEVAYTAAWTRPAGASISLKNPKLDNNVATSWCKETAAWTGSAGDKGTPGAAAGCQ